MTDLILKEESYAVIGAAIEVHRELGHGFLEAVYQEALQIELAVRNILSEPLKELTLQYKGHPLKKEYIADLVYFGQIVVELKALERLSGKEEAQVLNYLKATGHRLGLLINFGSRERLEWKRLVRYFFVFLRVPSCPSWMNR
jgi:GxxExxY protein